MTSEEEVRRNHCDNNKNFAEYNCKSSELITVVILTYNKILFDICETALGAYRAATYGVIKEQYQSQ